MGITDYGHRGVPNVFLDAPLHEQGRLERGALQEPDVRQAGERLRRRRSTCSAQRAAAKKIQELLLDETPIIYAYFYYFLTGTKKNVGNVEVSAMGHYDITKAGFTRRPDAAGAGPPWPGSSPSGIGSRAHHAVAAQHARLLHGERAAGQRGAAGPRPVRVDQTAVAALNHQLGTDQPLITQYLDWMKGYLPRRHGHARSSTRQPVSDVLWPALGHSAKLALLAFIIVVPLAILGGVVAALQRGHARATA